MFLKSNTLVKKCECQCESEKQNGQKLQPVYWHLTVREYESLIQIRSNKRENNNVVQSIEYDYLK